MKNLELLELVHKPVNDTFSQAKCFAQTSEFVYFIHNHSLHKYDCVHDVTTEISPESFTDVICVKLLSIEGKICVATPQELRIVDLDGIDRSVAFQEPIEAISWNPTEELVVTVSQSGVISTVSVDYESGEAFPRGSSSLDAQIPDTVYVGWGSKDTQFRGTVGKLKNQKPVEAEPITDKQPSISWRGNGEMFAVNYWKEHKRMFLVFETPCKAIYRSEDCPGLQSTIAWRPTGNMIATLSRVINEQHVVIFEKNGQKRFNFQLDFGDVHVKQLKWSPCAQILTISSEILSTNAQNIHLMTSSNYQWYEKQTLMFTNDNPLLDFDWLETTQFTFTLRVITKNEIINYKFRSVVNNSEGTCAVINGKILQITDFAEAVIPPPMCSKKFINDRSINFAIFGDSFMAIVDSGNYIKIVNVDKPETVLTTFQLREIIDNLPSFSLACHHFCCKGDEIYFAAESGSETVFYNLNVRNGDINFIDAYEGRLRHFVALENIEEIIGLKQIGRYLFINDNSLQNSIKQVSRIVDGKCYSYHLTSNCHFYVNSRKICDSVNSFVVCQDYLLFTTKLNELHCVRLMQEYMKDLLEGNLSKNYRRSVEQGSSIVTTVLNTPKIILQLPRGNLETISCRLISIDILNRLLNEDEWEEALRFIRLEKLNANLLFDLNPDRFLRRIDRFISNVKTVNELNSLCLEMEEGNVLKTLYENWGECEDFSGKISTIFGKILRYFYEIDYTPYISTIMIICLQFFTLADGLVYLQDLLGRVSEDSDSRKIVSDAINVLKTYGCDQEKLYTESLLLYDLNLARFVAGCCQIDPRIYEPHLNNLRNLPEVRRRYEIHMYGKQPNKAIAYLLRCPEVESNEILEFIKTHRVAREAYRNCKKGSPHYQAVSKAFATDLSRKGCHREAAVILKRANLSMEALEEFKLSSRWREALDLAKELKIGDVERLKIVDEMAGRLVERHEIKDAANLYEFYAENYEMAIRILIENYFLEEAMHVAKKYNRGDIIVSNIIPVLKKHKIYLEQKIGELDRTFDKHTTRLVEVRRLKTIRFIGDSYEGDNRDDELFSDAGSIVTRSSRSSRSRSSTASSRNRRKEAKKKQDLREGGVYEDIALIRALHCLIKEVFNKGEEVRSCCILLLQESDVSLQEIQALHDLYLTVFNKIRNNFTIIWPPHFYMNNPTREAQELFDLKNFEHLDIEFRTPPTGPDKWSLNLFVDI